MKEKFTPEEWSLLKILPFQVFVLVAGSDKKIDKKEIEQLQKDLKSAPFYKDPLHRELAVDILTSDIEALIKQAMDVSQFASRTSRVKTFLREKLTASEYQRFVGSLFVDGLKIARASGGGAFGLGDKVSDDEKLALAALATVFDLELSTLSEHFG
jgi:hypothetical protein